MTKKIVAFSLCFIFSLFFIFGCRVNAGANPVSATENNEVVTVVFNVTEPELAQTYTHGDKIVVRWNTDISSPNVDIELYRKTDKIFTLANDASGVPGVFEWNVPDGLPDSHHYRFLVKNSAKPLEHDYSEYFYIFALKN